VILVGKKRNTGAWKNEIVRHHSCQSYERVNNAKPKANNEPSNFIITCVWPGQVEAEAEADPSPISRRERTVSKSNCVEVMPAPDQRLERKVTMRRRNKFAIGSLSFL
jgi:hypothetical protein